MWKLIEIIGLIICIVGFVQSYNSGDNTGMVVWLALGIADINNILKEC